MKDLAELAGVSTSTISRALTNHDSIPQATRHAIQELAAKHGYVVNNSARSLRQSQTRTIALALPLAHEQDQLISDPFFLSLFGNLADEITKRGFDVLLVREPSPDAGWFERLIRSRRADGYIVIGQSTQHDALNAVADDFLPFVVGGSPLPGQRYCTVGSDNFGGGRIATEHLLKRGNRRVLFLGPFALPQIDQRLEGYKAALKQHRLPIAEELIIDAHFTGTSAYEQTCRALCSGLEFDAIFAASDGIAVSAIRALDSAGLTCPGDVAVVGFDDSDLALQSRPPLTTIRQDVAGMAIEIVRILFRRLEGFSTDSASLPIELVVRESAP
ncbi:MAG: substrate-binding domain-containing protein [Proteobacteria bacterium]|nr:substrate-binding domain-containing protein [Pseudomonadota bacterium]